MRLESKIPRIWGEDMQSIGWVEICNDDLLGVCDAMTGPALGREKEVALRSRFRGIGNIFLDKRSCRKSSRASPVAMSQYIPLIAALV